MKMDGKKTADYGLPMVMLKGVLLGLLVFAGCMLAFAAVLLIPNINGGLAAPFATVSLAAGTFVAAWYLAGKSAKKGYLVGAICGGAVFCAVTLLALAFGDGEFTLQTVFRLLILLLSGTVGGIVGVNRSAKRKYSV
ncbi:MAG: TIGR04086 family membrane protein [Clostridia bacterium]|nr:TIGR04086 family membrane protein [Clostridia bacterium]